MQRVLFCSKMILFPKLARQWWYWHKIFSNFISTLFYPTWTSGEVLDLNNYKVYLLNSRTAHVVNEWKCVETRHCAGVIAQSMRREDGTNVQWLRQHFRFEEDKNRWFIRANVTVGSYYMTKQGPTVLSM